VRSGAVEAVVVVPLEGGAFRPAVLAQVVDVGFTPARRDQQVVARRAGGEAEGDAAEVGDRLALGQAAGLAVEAARVVAAVQVNRELPDLVPQLVNEGDLGPPPGATADRGAWEGAAEGPEPGLLAAEDLRLRLADRDPDVILAELARDPQRRLEGNGRERLRDLGPEGQQPALALQRQQVRERAAAEGAEESSAP